jgi:hypothetical protein
MASVRSSSIAPHCAAWRRLLRPGLPVTPFLAEEVDRVTRQYERRFHGQQDAERLYPPTHLPSNFRHRGAGRGKPPPRMEEAR